ncbi:Phytosulfokine precursor protein (PSK) [Musa troglodytarum]|uniref:Phytosulfokine n=1 Tax=Musa troglodytarum TaxID=320322 RepID=A0A9E7H6K9_9LILI|nr:Phytosulfokine precursor protein (PSK) [Musa troglodytarum]
MSKKTMVVVFIALLLVSLAHAGRPNPVDPKKSSLQAVEKGMGGRTEGCEGAGEDECLVRRTLAAHTDYIYTQEHH